VFIPQVITIECAISDGAEDGRAYAQRFAHPGD
jgi:hypothetical protein